MKVYIDKSDLKKLKEVAEGKEELCCLNPWTHNNLGQKVELTISYRICNKTPFLRRLRIAINSAIRTFKKNMRV